MVDTGSDASLVPLSLLIQLGAEETSPGWLVSITGERKPVALFFVDVHIGDRILAGVRVIGEPDANEVILGRDVLNHLTLFLDGPEATLIIPDVKNVARLRRD